MGGKRTSELIPLCHPLPLTDLQVSITPDRAAGLLRIRAEAATTGQTGVEMEAMTAASVAALTVYDMVKGVERGVEVDGRAAAEQERRQERGRGSATPATTTRRPARASARRPQRGPHRQGPQATVTRRALRPHGQRRGGGRRPRRTRRARASRSGCRPRVRRSTARLVRRRGGPDRAAARRRPPPAYPLVVTTGGTGLTPRDVTPQATRAVIDYEVPGLAEAMRAAGRAITPLADLSRGVVGVRGRTLIVNLPGSPKGALESLAAIEPRARARPRDAGRAVRPRGAAEDGAMTLFGPFAEVPLYPLVFPLFWGAVVVFVLAMARHLRVFAAARADGPSPFADIPTRFVGLIRYAFLQTRMFQDRRAGLLHAGIFWGFVLLTIGTANVVTGGLIEQVLSIPFDGLLWALVSAHAERRRGARPRVDRLGVLPTARHPAARA